MNHPDLFEAFDIKGQLRLPGTSVSFGELPWNPHPAFEGVELKNLLTSRETGGQFSFHLVRIAPGKAIGDHIHQTQLETHEVIAGAGVCVNNGARIPCAPGVITVFPMGLPHQVQAGPGGLYLFAKFIPALL